MSPLVVAAWEAPRGGAGIEIPVFRLPVFRSPEAPRGGAGIEIALQSIPASRPRKPLVEGLVLK